GTRSSRRGTACCGSGGSCRPRGARESLAPRPARARPTQPASARPVSSERTSRTLQIDQLRDPLAMIRRVAERELGRLGALEVEVQVVLPGEPDAAVELDPGAGDLAVCV